MSGLDLQELITRGRFVMADAPSRLRVFEAVDGRKTVNEIAVLTSRHINNVRRDLTLLRDAGLIQQVSSKSRLPVYEKVPLARTIPVKYFQPLSKRPASDVPDASAPARRRARGRAGLAVPTEAEILEIAKRGEDQLHEFKAPGTEPTKLTKEIAALLNTSQGGMVLYGIEDDGTIVGTDISRQKLDQPLQNSIRSNIAPAATVSLHAVSVLGSEVIVIIVPPWNQRDVYQFQEKIYIRKGTNAFGLKPEEVKQLHSGRAVV